MDAPSAKPAHIVEPPPVPESDPAASRLRWARFRSRIPSFFFPLLALLLLGGVTAWWDAGFLMPGNLMLILREVAPAGIIAVGMTFVVIAGGIDLSVASLMVLSGGLGIMMLNAVADPSVLPPAGLWLHEAMAWPFEAVGLTGSVGVAVVACFAVMLLVGVLGGLINGVIITKGRVAAFIATLGGLLAYRSLAQALAEGANFTGTPRAADAPGDSYAVTDAFSTLGGTFDTGFQAFGMARPLQVPWSVLLFFAVALVGSLVLRLTRFGRYVYAVGANERAAIYSGIRTDRVKLLCYAIVGLLSGAAAMVVASRSNSISSGSTGLLLELEVIAAVVIGGARLSGGRGAVVGTVIGVLILGTLGNMLRLLDVPTYLQAFTQGVVIIAAVLLQRGGEQRI